MSSVLLVDDDNTTNFLNKLFLNQVDTNLEINTVSHGKEAIDFLLLNGEQITPCLIILDTNMPVMDGWGFLKAYGVKINENIRRKIKIIMMTATETEELVAEAKTHPLVDDAAQKPLSDVSFKSIIQKHFG